MQKRPCLKADSHQMFNNFSASYKISARRTARDRSTVRDRSTAGDRSTVRGFRSRQAKFCTANDDDDGYTDRHAERMGR
jgi:hypothetical protein